MGGTVVMLVYAALVLVVGTLVWRRMKMPAEIQRKQFKVLGLAVALLAGFGLFCWVLISHFQTLSPGAFLAILLGGIAVGITLLIVAVRRVTLPPAVPLPPSIHLIHTNRDKALRPLKGLGLLLLAILLIALAVPSKFLPIVLILGGTFALIYALVVLMVYLQARTADRALSTLEFAAPMHWRMPPQVWAQWVDSEVARTAATPIRFLWRRDWPTFAIMIGVTTGITLVLGAPALVKVAIIGGMAGMLLFFVAMGHRQQRTAPARLRSLLAASPAEAYFGAEGYACAGIYTNWMATDCFLTYAAIDASTPRRLAFIFRKTVSSGRTFQVVDVKQTVPIPPSAEADLPTLRQQLTMRCPEAHISI